MVAGGLLPFAKTSHQAGEAGACTGNSISLREFPMPQVVTFLLAACSRIAEESLQNLVESTLASPKAAHILHHQATASVPEAGRHTSAACVSSLRVCGP